jgi:hypothetical protein
MINTEVSVYVDDLIKRIVNKINQYPERKCLVSVVLTGSLGRDEGTFHISSDDSKLILDSDVELALIYRRGRKKLAKEIKRKLIADFNEEMNPMVISELRVKKGYNFNYSFSKPQKSSIFMYDLYNGSKTIWGAELLNKEVIPYDKYESKRIIANRIGELIYLESNEKVNGTQIITQWEGKLLLAIGSAFCILEDAYRSKYKAQRDYIMANKNRAKEAFGENFVEDYDKTYLFLREGGQSFKIQREKLIEYVALANIFMEKRKIFTPKINSVSRRLKYLIACIKSKSKFNPFTCEQDIIESLIFDFIVDNKEIVITAQAWKNILY